MTDQPAPKKNSNTPVWELVIHDMLARDREGRQRYGVPLQAGNGRDALQDAYEEALDLAVYLRQAIEERKGKLGMPCLAEHTTAERRRSVGTKRDRRNGFGTGFRTEPVRATDTVFTGVSGIRYVRPPITIDIPVCMQCGWGSHKACTRGACSCDCRKQPLDTGKSSG